MKHDWNAWLKNRVLREAGTGHPNSFKFEFEEEELWVHADGTHQVGYDAVYHLSKAGNPIRVDVKFIVNADWNKEEPMVKYGDNPYPGSPGHWEWDIEKILKTTFYPRSEGLNIPENDIIDSLRKHLKHENMQERLSDEAEKRSPTEPDWDRRGDRRSDWE